MSPFKPHSNISSGRCTLIITADDLGFSDSRNRAILDAVRFGTVSASSLMVNMPATENACRLVREQAPDLDVGLHFTLTSGRPVAPPESIPLLVDAQGEFRHGFVSLLKNAGRPEFQEQIRIEFQAQQRVMEELQSRYDLTVAHLDSHQHVHAIRPIRELLSLQAERSGWALRLPREPYGTIRRCFPFRALLPIGDLKKALLDHCLRNVVTDHLYFGVLQSGDMDFDAWRGILEVVKKNPGVLCEVNVHPGDDPKEFGAEPIRAGDADRRFHRDVRRRRELDVLLDPAFVELLKRYGQYPLRSWKTATSG